MGDSDTKFFRSFSNHLRMVNTIWELQDQGGRTIRGFKGLAETRGQSFRRVV